MKRTFGLFRTGRFAAAIILAVATVTAESSAAQETSAGEEKSSNTKPINDNLKRREIPPGIVVLESATKRLIGLVVMSDSRSWVAVSTREFHNRFGDIEEIELTDGKARHLAKRVHDDELRSISFVQVETQLPLEKLFTQLNGVLPKGSTLESLTIAGEGRALTSHTVTVTHPRTTLHSKPVDYFRVEPDVAGASCVLYHEGRVVGLGISQTRSDPSDETKLATEVLPMSTLLVAVEAYRRIENTKPLKQLFEKLYPKLSIEVHPVGGNVLLRGTVESDAIRRQLIEIAEQFFPKVLEQLHVAPAPRFEKNSSEKEADQFVQIGDDKLGFRAILKKLFPLAKLEVNFPGDAVLIRGRIARSADIKPIVEVAEQYFPKVLTYVVADDQPLASGPRSFHRGFGGRAPPTAAVVMTSVNQEVALDRDAKQLAARVRAVTEPEKSALRAELKMLTEKHFEHRQQRRDKDIAELAERVDKLRVAHHRRQENKADIIIRRVAELLDEDQDLKWDEASARRGDGEPTTARPAAGLPVPVLNGEATPKRLDVEKTSSTEDAKKVATAALVRAAEARRKLAEYELTKAEETNKKIPGTFPTLVIERFKANLEIANAELDAAEAGVDISRTNKTIHDDNAEPTYKGASLNEWLRLLENERNPEKLAEAVLAMNSLASDAEPRQLVRATLRMMQAYLNTKGYSTNSNITDGCVGLLCLAKSDVVVEEVIAELGTTPAKKLSLQFQIVLAKLLGELVRQPNGLSLEHVPHVSQEAVQSLRNELRRNSTRLVTALVHAAQRDLPLNEWLVGCAADLLSLSEQPLSAYSDLIPHVERAFADAKSGHQHTAARLLGSSKLRVPEILALAERWLLSNGVRRIADSGGFVRSEREFLAGIEVLAVVGRHSPQAITRLTETLRDRWTRFAEPSGKPGKPVTESAKSEFDLPDCAILIEALGRIGEPARRALPLLREIEQSPASESWVRDKAGSVVLLFPDRKPKTMRALVIATIQQIENVQLRPNTDSRTDEK